MSNQKKIALWALYYFNLAMVGFQASGMIVEHFIHYWFAQFLLGLVVGWIWLWWLRDSLISRILQDQLLK